MQVPLKTSQYRDKTLEAIFFLKNSSMFVWIVENRKYRFFLWKFLLLQETISVLLSVTKKMYFQQGPVGLKIHPDKITTT